MENKRKYTKTLVREAIEEMMSHNDLDDIKREIKISDNVILEINCFRAEEDLYAYDDDGAIVDKVHDAGEPMWIEAYIIKKGIAEDSYTTYSVHNIKKTIEEIMELVRMWK